MNLTLSILAIAIIAAPWVVWGKSVTLAWDRSPDPIVTGYNVYYGTASRTYTEMVNAGNETNAVIVGLVDGVTYYFAATTYAASGMESPFSEEVSYTPPVHLEITMEYNEVHKAKSFVISSDGPGGAWQLWRSSDLLHWELLQTGSGPIVGLRFPTTGSSEFFKLSY